MMNNINDTQLIHVRVKNSLLKKFDVAVKRLCYRSRSEAVNALIAAVCYEATPEERGDKPVPESFEAWADTNVPKVSEADIRRSLEAVLRRMAFPVIARKGAREAFLSMGRYVLSEVHDETGVWLSEGEVATAFEQFELLNKRQLYDHRCMSYDAFPEGYAEEEEEKNN